MSVARLEFWTPEGRRYELYSRNALMRSSPEVQRVLFAHNDPKGRWRLHAHDLMSGRTIETGFDLA